MITEIGNAAWREVEPVLLAELRKPPGLLYHYTDAGGILGIFTQTELWATHHAFMNDPMEGRQFLRVLSGTAQNLGEAIDGSSGSVKKYLMSNLGTPPTYRLGTTWYVVSMTEHPDHLTHWRLYGADGAGFCIGMSSEQLGSLRTPACSSFALIPVVYRPDEQRRLCELAVAGISAAVERAFDWVEGLKAQPARGNLLRAGALYARALADDRFAALFKQQSYESECEWRLVYRGIDPLVLPDEDDGALRARVKDFESLSFRAAGQTITPFLRVPLASPAAMVSEVRTGPRQDFLKASLSLRGLFASRRMIPWPKIIASEHAYSGR